MIVNTFELNCKWKVVPHFPVFAARIVNVWVVLIRVEQKEGSELANLNTDPGPVGKRCSAIL